MTFYPGNLPHVISIGTGSDNDTYTYDSNTNRMTGYSFTLGSKSDAGTLTWNAVGTLKSLAITDGFNSGGTQTCNFGSSGTMGYDDLNRLLSDVCGSGGSIWNQTYSYDQYDNLTKSSTGFVSWNPGYNSSNNHYTCTGCTYDSNGNVTNDGTTAYTWNEFSKMASTNKSGTNCASAGQCIVYDAMGKIVEIDSGSTYTSIWYTQLGKTAYMNGSTYLYSYWPAPGGGTAMHNSSGTVYFMHKDWLGNVRLGSNLGTNIIDDYAFAPYGEKYDIFGSTSQNETMFTGDTQDVLAGMYDTPNRELQGSQQGRWLSPDPAGAGWNLYAYVNNNPLGNIDPSGLACLPLEKSLFGCGASLANGVSFSFEFGSPPNGNCTMDGVDANCNAVYAAMQSDGAGRCPNNNCENVRYEPTGWFRFELKKDLVLNCAGTASNPDQSCYWSQWSLQFIAGPNDMPFDAILHGAAVNGAQRSYWEQTHQADLRIQQLSNMVTYDSFENVITPCEFFTNSTGAAGLMAGLPDPWPYAIGASGFAVSLGCD